MSPSTASPLLEMRAVSKHFPGVCALDSVDFSVHAGEIHALMGENGAGKSTLVKVLTGVYLRDGGDLQLAGEALSPRSPREAEAAGISTVYQEVNLVPHLSVAENICLGRQPTRFGAIRWGAVRQRARAALARLGLAIDVERELAACSIAVQQMVAIARALDVDARLLILDEPTSSLDEREVEELFAVLRRLRDQGLGIVFITHFLDQVYAVADRITVLRDGCRVGTFATRELPRLELVGKMIGMDPDQVRVLTTRHPPQPSQRGAALLEARGLERRGSLAPVDLAIASGETVGLAGLLGSGRSELARLLFGIDRASAGELWIEGRRIALRSPEQAIRCGLALTPEDRKAAGIIPNLSVRENIVLALQARRGFLRALSRRRQGEIAERFIATLGIKTPTPEQPVSRLSGGNQQKVLLARWLALEPRLLILDEPTRGIDVGAKAEIERLMGELCGAGMAIVFISSELEEVARDSHRVVVLRDRRKVGELAGEEIAVSAILELIAAHEPEASHDA